MTPLLLVHIATASVNLLICMIAWIQPTRKTQICLRVLSALSLASGTALALEPGHLTRTFCIRLGVYLVMIATTEMMLYRRQKSAFNLK